MATGFQVDQLQLPRPIIPGQVDWRPLGEIGDAVAANRRKQAIAETLAGATDASGNLNVDRAGTALAQIGLLDEARPILALAQQKAALAQHGQALDETARHNRAVEGLARDAYDNPKPTVHQAFNPASGQVEFYETRPGSPVRNLSQPSPAAPSAATPMPGSTEPIVPNQVRTEAVQPTAAPQQPAVQPSPVQAAPKPGAFNDAAIANLAPNIQALIKKVVAYEVSPTSLSTRGGQRDFIIGKASEYDPTFDQAVYPTKQRTMGAFSAGPEARTLRAVNNLTDHLDTAEELVKALNNGTPQAINGLVNKVKAQFGYTPPTNLAAAAPIIGGEITKVIAGLGAGGVSERAEAAASILGQAKTEQQALEAIGVIKKLMGGQIHGLESQYESGTRLKNFREKLSPGARKIIEASEGKTTETKAETPAIEKVKNSAEANEITGKVKARMEENIAAGANPKEELARANEFLRSRGAPPISGP